MNITKKGHTYRQAGFTLIELLVVIAIIGILTSVVLGSLNRARDKGANAAIKSGLHGLRAQADIIYDNNNQDYTNVCADTKVGEIITVAITTGADLGATVATRCNSTIDEWAANVAFKAPDTDGSLYWCVDSTGVAKGEMAELAGATVCS